MKFMENKSKEWNNIKMCLLHEVKCKLCCNVLSILHKGCSDWFTGYKFCSVNVCIALFCLILSWNSNENIINFLIQYSTYFKFTWALKFTCKTSMAPSYSVLELLLMLINSLFKPCAIITDNACEYIYNFIF